MTGKKTYILIEKIDDEVTLFQGTDRKAVLDKMAERVMLCIEDRFDPVTARENNDAIRRYLAGEDKDASFLNGGFQFDNESAWVYDGANTWEIVAEDAIEIVG